MTKSKVASRNSNITTKQADEKYLIPRPRSGGISAVIAYPNRYWVAMSNLGFQAVYRLFAEQPRYSVQRAFIPESAGEKITTFEKGEPLSKAEILALSVSFETDYPHVLQLIEAAGVNLQTCSELSRTPGAVDESTFRPLILGGGAALTLNPEPIANFFDAIVIGEGEEIVPEICAEYLRWRDASGRSRRELLLALANLAGVYVPAFYSPSYRPQGEIFSFSAQPQVPERVQRRFVEDIDKFSTNTVIQTANTEFKSMFMTETGRGCEVGCKFCVAGYMYRPTRKRSAETIEEGLQIGLANSDSIGFVGAAVSSHPKIAELASSVARQGKRAALSSIMSQRVSKELAASISESEYKTVALAPEAGSEELRFRVGKRVCNQQIEDAISTLASSGIKHFKLYFIVGLPAEKIADVLAICHLVERLRAAALRGAREHGGRSVVPTIFLSVNPFIPKAWTPFQRHGFLSFAQLEERLQIVRQGIRQLPNVEMKHESPRESYFQALMSRGDRRVGDVLLYMHQNKRDWRWLVKNGSNEIVVGVPPADFYVQRQIGAEELLPWEIVDLRIRRSLLEREYQRTFSEEVFSLIERAQQKYRVKLAKGVGEDEIHCSSS